MSEGRKYMTCDLCGGRCHYDTSVPSVVWNAVIRAQGLPEFLCLACVVREFAKQNRSFTATLWGDEFNGLSVEIRIGGEVARDAVEVSKENTALRAKLSRWEAGELTPDEIHNICHNLPATVSLSEFAEGCRRQMLELYGTCPFDPNE